MTAGVAMEASVEVPLALSAISVTIPHNSNPEQFCCKRTIAGLIKE